MGLLYWDSEGAGGGTLLGLWGIVLLSCYNQTPDKSNLRKGLFCLIDWGAAHHGCEVMATEA